LSLNQQLTSAKQLCYNNDKCNWGCNDVSGRCKKNRAAFRIICNYKRMKILVNIFFFGLIIQAAYGQTKVLVGKGESGIVGYYNDWTIRILNNDSIELLCSMKTDSLDIRSMNNQYFGHLTSAEHYETKVIIDKVLYVDDCNKPLGFKKDTIPFYIDSLLFNEVNYWDLEVKRIESEDTIIRITNTLYELYAKWDKEYTMIIYPEKKSGYLPISIKTGGRCAVVIGNFRPEMDYYINKTSEGYELIGDITPYVNMQNKKCDYCIKRTKLKLIQ
jgi:hypothetical protein